MVNKCTIKCGRPAKGDEASSRDRLITSATQLFLENDYGNLTLETIARDAHVSLRTIYSEFGGKAGLFGALVRRCSDQWIHSLSVDMPLEEALTGFGREFLYRTTRPDAIRMRAILIGESPRFPDIAHQFYEQGPRRTLNYLAEFFLHHQQMGNISGFDSHFLADQFLSALRGECFQKLQLGLQSPPEQSEINDAVQKKIGLFLRGCLSDCK